MIESNIELYNDILLKVQFFYKSLKLEGQEKEKGRKLAIPIPEIIGITLNCITKIIIKNIDFLLFEEIFSYKFILKFYFDRLFLSFCSLEEFPFLEFKHVCNYIARGLLYFII